MICYTLKHRTLFGGAIMVFHPLFSILLQHRSKRLATIATAILLLFSACTAPDADIETQTKNDLIQIKVHAKEQLSYDKDIKPILEKRCIVCHGCYDAPCQLKLSSFEGIQRGANKQRVYPLLAEPRLSYQPPTRLFIDAQTTGEWRDLDFFSVLNREQSQSVEANLRGSVLYKMLSLKQSKSTLFPDSGMLPEDLDVGLERKQVCTTLDEFDDFAKDHPRWGMPYALPGLPDGEYNKLVQWLGQGAQGPSLSPLSSEIRGEIEKWENFFNAKSKKERLVSRYIYEHLVLGHLYFASDVTANNGNPRFFRLVRSRTPSGQPVEEIPSIRPNDDPGIDPFYYRLRLYPASIVDKNHITYELSDKRMQRYQELFLQPEYDVKELPRYNWAESRYWLKRKFVQLGKFLGIIKPITPFEAFAAIPPKARYQFLLDDARFFINGFIKGPVCRGQSALSSIEDHFWVFFLKPENPPAPFTLQHGLDATFLNEMDQYLHLPTELGDTNRLAAPWARYWPQEQRYMQAKLDHYYPQNSRNALIDGVSDFLHLSDKNTQWLQDKLGAYLPKKEGENIPLLPIDKALDYFVWNGTQGNGKKNQNAALTIFRNYDSASVHYGLLGEKPETAWLLDYPVFERLHYLLVAEYNVFGTVGHQLSARLYMDFLRIEAEDNFLFFLPRLDREIIYKKWHDIDRKTNFKQWKATQRWLAQRTVTGYEQVPDEKLYNQPKLELYSRLKKHAASPPPDYLSNPCNEDDCSEIDQEMQKLGNILKGKILQIFPEISYVRVGNPGWATDDGGAYTLVHNKSYRTNTFAKETNNRSDEDMKDDTLTVLKGMAGSYPNFFFQVTPANVKDFVTACSKIRNRGDYERMVTTYGIRRTNPDFWHAADWFQTRHAQNQPIESGILDLSRYKDR